MLCMLSSLCLVEIYQQTLEEMLRAGGPDWQRVLGYVESMYRHFEMWPPGVLTNRPVEDIWIFIVMAVVCMQCCFFDCLETGATDNIVLDIEVQDVNSGNYSGHSDKKQKIYFFFVLWICLNIYSTSTDPPPGPVWSTCTRCLLYSQNQIFPAEQTCL